MSFFCFIDWDTYKLTFVYADDLIVVQNFLRNVRKVIDANGWIITSVSTNKNRVLTT